MSSVPVSVSDSVSESASKLVNFASILEDQIVVMRDAAPLVEVLHELRQVVNVKGN